MVVMCSTCGFRFFGVLWSSVWCWWMLKWCCLLMIVTSRRLNLMVFLISACVLMSSFSSLLVSLLRMLVRCVEDCVWIFVVDYLFDVVYDDVEVGCRVV